MSEQVLVAGAGPTGLTLAIDLARRGVDVRIVAATNEDLPALVSQGRFRADLLDRLSFEVVTLPPLRAREGDIAVLANHFGRRMANELERAGWPGFAEGAMAEILLHCFNQVHFL